MKISYIFSGLILWSCMAWSQWDLNDVSYLMPLPSSFQEDTLLRMDHPARGGTLLHPQFLKQIPALILASRPEDMLKTLRVISVRIDPCFPLPTPQSCQRQVRLIWQPLEQDRRQGLRTADAALHSFYVLNDQEFLNLLKDISLWKSRYQFSTRGKALQIHPAWARVGTRSPALAEFQNLILRHVGMANFKRVTAMFLRGAGNMWAFASYELNGGKLDPQPIARLNGKRSQTFINLAVPSDHFESAGMSPKAQGSDVIDSLLELPITQGTVTEEAIRRSFGPLYKMENPRFFHAENLDCVSCHVTQPIKHAFYNKRPELKLHQAWPELQYTNPRFNLQNLSPQLNDTQIVRAFGYFGQQPAISQRVIHESAEVADWLNRQLR